jgi:hypothetical protein
MSKTAAVLEPVLVTSTLVPASLVVTVPMDRVAAAPAVPPSPWSPLGKLKLNTLLVAVEVASSVIVAVVPASVVVTVPIFIAGVVPSVPSSPAGIVKSNILFVVVDEGETETETELPGVPVVTVPTEMLTLSPSSPSAPRGMPMSKTAAVSVPVLVTSTLVPAFLVVTVPIDKVAAAPASPPSPVSPLGKVKSNTLFMAVEGRVFGHGRCCSRISRSDGSNIY